MFENTLFRCSALGYLMTEPQSKAAKDAGELSESCKTHLVDVYVSTKYGRQTDISNKYTEKGLMVEEDSITLYSRVKKSFFKKNEEHLHNEYIKGTPDMFVGPDIHHAVKIIDTKSSWDIFSFFRARTSALNKMYYWQLQGYMALTGACMATVAYCLVNTPEVLISDEKRRLLFKMNAGTEENQDYKDACLELDKLMVYDDIPMHERVIEFHFDRCEEDIQRLYKKVERARKYLIELEKSFNPSAMIAEHKPELGATIIDKIVLTKIN